MSNQNQNLPAPGDSMMMMTTTTTSSNSEPMSIETTATTTTTISTVMATAATTPTTATTTSTIDNNKTCQSNEELPYFLEKYPGKLCALCNLPERSQLGQGEMLRIQTNEEEQIALSSSCFNSDNDKMQLLGRNDKCSNNFNQLNNRRQKGQNKHKNITSTTDHHVDELEKIGHLELTDFSSLIDLNNFYYVHRLCVTWSFDVCKNQIGEFTNATAIISRSLQQCCSYCNRFGASIICKMSCSKTFHFPCVAAGGGIQIIQNYTTFCKEHTIQAQIICADINIVCRSCSELGNTSNLVTCAACGDLYHGTCIGLPQLPGVRAGWQCRTCNKCQICRVSDSNDGRSLLCEQCHKLYHANCLRPIMTSIPKYGWKCRCCRVCSDCGSRTPGAGTSSRWHSHYTICDSCYQQRNKGFSCPICRRAYRAAAHKEMVKCSLCHKFVHSTCDSDADLQIYHSKKENNPDYDYVCPPCYNQPLSHGKFHKPPAIQKSNQIEDDNISNSQDSSYVEDAENDSFEKLSEYSFGKGKPYSAIRVAKRRMGFAFAQASRNKGKCVYQKRQRFPECGRKRGPKSKIRTLFGFQEHQRSYNESSNHKIDEEPGVENRLILCSAKDKFLFTQDVCVMCGAIGTDHEGCLISCTQCGQCYHPYCVNVKVTKVILEKGWRCLDCTVCEGCGQKNDEARLILCDECDISFHIYCMDPPLDFVPQGNWKCRWCAVCQKCGKNNSGGGASLGKHNYSECGSCASKTTCSVCSVNYNDKELIIKCGTCEKWLHAACDGMKNEEEIAKISTNNIYNCLYCRPKNTPVSGINSSESSLLNGDNFCNKQINENSNDQVTNLEAAHFIDGVYLSARGLTVIKSLQIEFKKKRKPKFFAEVNLNDAGILAAIESVVSGGLDADISKRVEPFNALEEADIYTDGMIWEKSDASPPEGFTVCTNENGLFVLKKKRQRNLQKLGIGGFNVRNRGLKKDTNVDETHDSTNNSSTVVLKEFDSDKRRKSIKKKPKNKLSEAYPAYLQEAFFGKLLLDTHKVSTLESESSDDDTRSNVSDDKVILEIPGGNSKPLVEMLKTEPEISIKSESLDIFKIPENENQPTEMSSIEQNKIITIIPEPKKEIADVNTFGTSIPIPDIDKQQIPNKILQPGTNIHLPSSYLNDEMDNKIFTKDLLLDNNLISSSSTIKKSDYKEIYQNNREHPTTNLIENTWTAAINTDTYKNNLIVQSEEESMSMLVSSASCSQRSSERMRRDEELGEMATISAVLYANTKHPGLRQEYPIWNDRCKQIYKRWRSLSNENKAPFLQRARENRSALRMKKVQQDQDKNTSQQKAYKEQERERLWKQHQAMRAKEQFQSFNGMKDPSIDNLDTNLNVFIDDAVDSTELINREMKNSPHILTKKEPPPSPAPSIMQYQCENVIMDDNKMTPFLNQINNKQLRDLLQKQAVKEQFIENSCYGNQSTTTTAATATTLLNSPINVNSNLHHTTLNGEIKLNDQIIKNRSKTNLKNEKTNQQHHIKQSSNSGDSFRKTTKDTKINLKKLNERTEQEETTAAINEVGDLLGGLENDDDLLQSLTYEMTEHFNILEYTDPALDVLNDDNQHLFDKLDFDEDKSKTFFDDSNNLEEQTKVVNTTKNTGKVRGRQENSNTNKKKPSAKKKTKEGKIDKYGNNKNATGINGKKASEIVITENTLKSPPPYPGLPPPYPDVVKAYNQQPNKLPTNNLVSGISIPNDNNQFIPKSRNNMNDHVISADSTRFPISTITTTDRNIVSLTPQNKQSLHLQKEFTHSPIRDDSSKNKLLDHINVCRINGYQSNDNYNVDHTKQNKFHNLEHITNHNNKIILNKNNSNLNRKNIEHLMDQSSSSSSSSLCNIPSNYNSNRGGGISDINKDVIPLCTYEKSTKIIKLGLLGGAPMWNLTDISKQNPNKLVRKTTLVICESPNDNTPGKSQLVEYDDFNDKGVVTTEVSLNSVAQNITDNDEMAVIESFASAELTDIVSSPLELEVAEEYVLFSSDVVDYAESDECMRISSSQKIDVTTKIDQSDQHDYSTNSDSVLSKVEICESKTTNDIISMKCKNDNNLMPKHNLFELKDDFEDRFKIGNDTLVKKLSNNNDADVIGPAIPGSSNISTDSQQLTDTTDTNVVKSKIGIITTTSGGTLLKTTTMSSNNVNLLNNEHISSCSSSITSRPSTSLNINTQPSESSFVSSHLDTRTSPNAKVLQNSMSSKKHSSSSSSYASSSKTNLVHNFVYPKLSQLSVLQDISLPSNIFEDESTSPKSMSSTSSNDSHENGLLNFKDSPLFNLMELSTDFEPPSENKNDKIIDTIPSEKSPIKNIEKNFKSIPQLSPLSKPTEMTTNLDNVSQQLRTIMSSINMPQTTQEETNSSEDVKVSIQKNNNNQFVVSKVNTDSEMLNSKLLSIPDSTSIKKITPDHLRKDINYLFSSGSNNSKGQSSVSSNIGIINKNIEKQNITSNCNSNSSLKRSKSTEEGIEKELPGQITGTKRYSLEVITSKVDASDGEPAPKYSKQSDNILFDTKNTAFQKLKTDDSQNVLLKQLLQSSGSGNGTSLAPQTLTGIKVTSLRAPSLGMVSSLEAQLARPSLPPVPPDAQQLPVKKMKKIIENTSVNVNIKNNDIRDLVTSKPVQLITRETSFISNPMKSRISNITTDHLNSDKINNTTIIPPTNVPKKMEPINEKEQIHNNTNTTTTNTTNNTTIQKETAKQVVIKKPQITVENNNPTIVNNIINDVDSGGKNSKKEIKQQEANLELKKKRKRDYQKNRKISASKDIQNSTKKRCRKYSKIDEDYDSFIDNLMTQIRQMSPLQVLEPLLNRSYNLCPIHGGSDGSKTTTISDNQNSNYNNNTPGSNNSNNLLYDYYNSQPFENENLVLTNQEHQIQNGFYDNEFPTIKDEIEKTYVETIEKTLKNRNLDTPGSYIDSSSPECCYSSTDNLSHFDENDRNVDDKFNERNISPALKLFAPVPIKPWNNIAVLQAFEEKSHYFERGELYSNLQQDTNISVTITVTSNAADSILSVLTDLANLLRITPPSAYKILNNNPILDQFTNNHFDTTKSKMMDKKNIIDIQKILNGCGKFCNICDLLIIKDAIRIEDPEYSVTKKFFLKNMKFLYFCSKTCYKQYQCSLSNINTNSNRNDETTDEKKKISIGLDTENIEFKLNKDTLNNKTLEIEQSSIAAATELVNFKYFLKNCPSFHIKCKKLTEKEIVDMLFKLNITVRPETKLSDDTRQCILCGIIGDGIADGCSRLLNLDVNKWIHLNCALWSDGVYETVNGGLMNVEAALQLSVNQKCAECNKVGATVKCFKNRCGNIYHLSCAIKDNCVFYKNKTIYCLIHAPKNEKENELLTLSVPRRVYVERDESRQVAAVMHQSDVTNLLRVGGLIFLNVGQILPHQLQAFHNQHFIYPIGYKIIRFYWSMRKPNKRCRYVCSISDGGGRPEFRVLIKEYGEEDLEFKDLTPILVWQTILTEIASIRRKFQLVQLFPKYITGEDLFGLTEPTIVRILESLPGIETLTDYRFKYGRNPLLELPLAINSSGAARTEPKQKQIFNWKKSYTQRTSSSANQRLPLAPTVSVAGEVTCPYSKQFVHSKSSQYKKMKLDWRNNVYLARSKIQGLGLYGARDLEKHTMVIEYIGEVIRTEVSEIREKQYEAKNRGIYMFRLDENRVVDATLSGGLARYINHSCNPNCVTEIVEVDREYRIIIFAKRRITRGEELSYDYKFDIEEDGSKISCMCGAPNCKKWMN